LRVKVLALLVLVALMGWGAKSRSRASVTKVEGQRDGVRFIVKVYVSGPFKYKTVTLDPNRIAVDLANTVVAGPIEAPSPDDPTILRVRVGQHQNKPPVVRVVVDLRQPTQYAVSKEGDRVLVITMVTTYEPAPTPPAPSPAPEPKTLKAGIPAIDLHCDTVVKKLYPDNIAAFANGDFHVTLAKMKQGSVAGQVFAIWTNARTIPDGYIYANTMIDCFYDFLKAYPNDLAFAGCAQDFEQNRMKGKISAFLSLEGAEPVRTLDDLNYFYQRGVRMIGLAWNYQTVICDTAFDDPERNPTPYQGLSPFGVEAVKRMNQVGILIDVSHASDDTVRDVLAASTDPIVASHSCAAHFMPHYRNLKDELIVGICARGGVIGVIFNPPFLIPDKKNATIAHVADHVEYIARLGGTECVALGSDFDGGIHPPPGLEDSSQIQNLADVLRQRGWTEDKLRKLYFGNFLRLLRQVVDE